MLLPKSDSDEELEEEDDPQFEIIYKLVEYCRFKEVAQKMQVREEEQCSYFPRGVRAPSGDIIQPSIGIEHLTLEDLERILQKSLDKAAHKRSIIKEEEWRVSDKMVSIRSMIQDAPKVRLDHLFTSDHSQVEMIVTFLAILELMKLCEIQVVWNDDQTHAIMLRGTENVEEEQS
jgi:segregation and condensation protein A